MPSTRMPDLRLSDSEARDLTAYLYDNKNYDFDQLDPPIADDVVLDELTLDWLMKMNPEKYARQKLSKMNKNEKMSFVGEKVSDTMVVTDATISMVLWMQNQWC